MDRLSLDRNILTPSSVSLNLADEVSCFDGTSRYHFVPWMERTGANLAQIHPIKSRKVQVQEDRMPRYRDVCRRTSTNTWRWNCSQSQKPVMGDRTMRYTIKYWKPHPAPLDQDSCNHKLKIGIDWEGKRWTRLGTEILFIVDRETESESLFGNPFCGIFMIQHKKLWGPLRYYY